MDDNPTASCEGSVTDSLTTARSPKAGLAESARLGVVIVGRNEGDRLRRCLASLLSRASLLVYVDSGSSDNSLALAAQMGAQVLELDCTIPFTAARARNAGFAKLRELEPDL